MEYPNQIDLTWLAVDASSRLAAFATGGEGPIPAQILESTIDLREIEEALLALPSVGTASLHVEAPNPESFKALSERGLFVYDWTDVHRSRASAKGSYELVATPSVALELGKLPIHLRQLATPFGGPDLFGAAKLKVS